ncbi:MAG: RDD family protein [Acholeplasmataceae bacterium]
MVPSFEKRVRAFAIDTSGVSLFIIVSLFLGVYYEPLPWIVSGLAFFGFYFFPYFLKKTHGQTLGKKVQRIQIVKLDDSRVELWRLLLRDIFKLTLSIGTFGLYLIISFFVMSDKTSRTIHDYIFKTKVVDLEKPTGKYDAFNKTESMRKRGF